jgi:hypothetical protein
MLTAMFAVLAAVFVLCTLQAVAAVTWTATPFNPASVPLAVRSPYLSAWLNQGSGTALNADWPRFWTGSVSISFRALAFVSSVPTNISTRSWDGQDLSRLMASRIIFWVIPVCQQHSRSPSRRASQ